MDVWRHAAVALSFFLAFQLCTPDLSYGDDSTSVSGGVTGELIATLTLGKTRAYTGESVPFAVTLENTFDSPASVTSFLDTNRSLKITLKSREGKMYTADQMSHKERDGISTAERINPEGVSLPPGGKLFLRGDLLEWLGTVPAGRYRAEVAYTGILRQTRSRPIELTILPVSIVSADISRCGAQKKDSPICAAWIRKEKGVSVIFSQVSSPKVPRNLIHCAEAARPRGKVLSYGAACMPGPDSLFSSVYWMDDGYVFSYAVTGSRISSMETPVRVELPFEGLPAGSPLLMADRTMIAPFFCKEKDGFALVKVPPSGGPEIHRYVVDGISAVARRSIFWEEDRTLHLFWLQGKTAVCHAVLSLRDPEKGFSSPAAIDAGAEVVHFIPYLDSSIPAETLQYLSLGVANPVEDTVLPRIRIWCVTVKPAGLSCARLGEGNGPSEPASVIKIKRLKGLRIIGSAVTNEYGLALLLKDGRGRLWYGSTMRGSAAPIDAVTKSKIRMSDSPDIVASRTAPWVYLQYVRKGKALEYIRLEPENGRDPVEISRNKTRSG